MSFMLAPTCHSVFSAQAEVFPPEVPFTNVEQGFLRASGGVSHLAFFRAPCGQFSPRKRRCFYKTLMGADYAPVFSAQAEVFPKNTQTKKKTMGFLRASGGVSHPDTLQPQGKRFSPRKRRCFSFMIYIEVDKFVFSAQAEVFLSASKSSLISLGFLRASGGVSF